MRRPGATFGPTYLVVRRVRHEGFLTALAYCRTEAVRLSYGWIHFETPASRVMTTGNKLSQSNHRSRCGSDRISSGCDLIPMQEVACAAARQFLRLRPQLYTSAKISPHGRHPGRTTDTYCVHAEEYSSREVQYGYLQVQRNRGHTSES